LSWSGRQKKCEFHGLTTVAGWKWRAEEAKKNPRERYHMVSRIGRVVEKNRNQKKMGGMPDHK